MENAGPYAGRKTDQYAAGAQIQQLPTDGVQPKADGQRHWDRDDPRMTNQWTSHQYAEAQVGNATRSQFRGQMAHPDRGLEKVIEQDMELGYEDKPLPLTLEILEKKFSDEVMRLAKEESEADDAENARHKEKKMEISNQYQEKLLALRALQAKRREEFLDKETQERLHKHQQRQQLLQQEQQLLLQQQHQPVPNNYPTDRGALDPRGYDPRHYPNSGAVDPRGYGPNHYPTGTSPRDPRGYGRSPIIEPPHGGYTPGAYEAYRERSPYRHVLRNPQEAEGKVPTPQGRAYNNTRARNF